MWTKEILRAFALSTISLAALAMNVKADEMSCFAQDGMDESRKYLSSSFQWENDIGFSDRWYTNGMKYQRTKNIECNKDVLDNKIGGLLASRGNSVLLPTWLVGMNMYTPRIITISGAQPNDRPWTGWAYLGRGWRSVDLDETNLNERTSKNLEIQIGVLGEWAHQGDVQRAWHTLIGAQAPQGWANQKKGEAGASIGYTVQKNWALTNYNVAFSARGGAIVGNVVTQASTGFGISYTTERFALDDASYIPVGFLSEPKQIAPAFQMALMDMDSNPVHTKQNGVESESSKVDLSNMKLATSRARWNNFSTWTAFADTELKLIGYSTFISGTDITLQPFVLDAKLGAAHKFANSDCTFRVSWINRSPEFKYPAGNDAPWQRIWQISFEWDWGMVKNPIN